MTTELINVNHPLTMTSREIAELTGKRHDHVVRDIGNMLKKLDAWTVPDFGDTYINEQNGQEYRMFRLPKRETLILISGYSVALRARIIDRWQELEARQQPVVPTTFADALRLAADQQERIAKLALENHQQAEKIDVLENLLAKGVSAPEFCRHLNGVNTQAINKHLQGKGWLYESRGQYASWKVASYARDQYMTERAIEVSSSSGAFSVSKAVLLKKGARWLIHQYMQGRLPMKKTWDGVFKHDMTGVLEVAV